MTTIKDIIEVADKFCTVWQDIRPVLSRFEGLDVSKLQTLLGFFGGGKD